MCVCRHGSVTATSASIIHFFTVLFCLSVCVVLESVVVYMLCFPPYACLYRLYIGIADGMSIARAHACRYSKNGRT